MKILIGYDGSLAADAALEDLKTAGLPAEDVEAIVLSVAELWYSGEEIHHEAAEDLESHPQHFNAHALDAEAVAEAETFADDARRRLLENFPQWKVEAAATSGSPAREIITKADEINADLIVVGSHGRSAVGRFFLGSISQKVLTEAHCSVRVARGGRIEVDPNRSSRIIVGYDGSKGAQAAIESVASRFWREGSEARLVTACDSLAPAAIERFVPLDINWVEDELRAERERIEERAEKLLQSLRSSNLAATVHVHVGNPKTVLAGEATRWQADSIFVGANAFGNRVERFLLGSVSAAVAARAACSVEVVRKKQ